MQSEPTIAVLSERVRQLQQELGDFKRHTKEEMKDMHDNVERTRRIADEVNYSVKYIQDAVDKMDGMMGNFIGVVNDQNKKIDDFINSDKRMDHKRQFVVSVLQVASGIVIALVTFWGAGKM